MKKILMSTALLLTVGLNAPAAHAATTTSTKTTCKVTTAGTRNKTGQGGQFTLNDNGTVTGQFKVEGDNCAVAMASWTAPSVDGKPYDEQKLFDSTTGTFSTGVHQLTVKLPGCFYQIDLVPGTSATDSKGGPEYFTNGGRHVIGSLHGGSTSCTPAKPTTTPPQPTTPAATTLPNTGMNPAGAGVAALVTGVLGSFFYRKRLLAREA
ncbi:MAG TPA: hypothetical protein VFH39_00220 [Candidatus Saccharimonadales bacterium]|nr:hypothetical protein [Candidatus Saccharimonadales bacterium]